MEMEQRQRLNENEEEREEGEGAVVVANGRPDPPVVKSGGWPAAVEIEKGVLSQR